MTTDYSGNLLAQNAFDEIKIEGLLQRLEGEDQTRIAATLAHMAIPENLIDPFPHPDLIDSEHMEGLVRPEEDFEPNGPLPRPPSKLPPPAHATLSFKLGKHIAFGLTGIVYEAIDVRVVPSSEHDITLTGYLPPLVVKLGRSNRCMSMARAAWFYREMECLQGIAIARCYGTFDLEVPRDMLVEPWQDPINSTIYDNDYEELPDFEEYPEEALEEKAVDPHPMLKKLVATRNRLCITVLERLGPALESGVVHPPEVKEDISSMYTNLAHLGVHMSNTIDRRNILHAPKSPPGIPSQVSPFTGRTHAWRAIDFDGALKTPYLRWITNGEHDEWLDVMWAGISWWGKSPSDDFVWPPGVTVR